MAGEIKLAGPSRPRLLATFITSNLRATDHYGHRMKAYSRLIRAPNSDSFSSIRS